MNDTEYLKSSKKTYRDIRHSLTSRKGVTFESIDEFNKHYSLDTEKITIFTGTTATEELLAALEFCKEDRLHLINPENNKHHTCYEEMVEGIVDSGQYYFIATQSKEFLQTIANIILLRKKEDYIKLIRSHNGIIEVVYNQESIIISIDNDFELR